MRLTIGGKEIFNLTLRSHETDGVNLTDPDTFLRLFGNGRQSKSGVSVSEETAMTSSAVFSCVRILSETLASLPLAVYERTDSGREKAYDHPIYRLLHDDPNGQMTAYVFKQLMMVFASLWGNGYARIVRRGDMRPQSLDILHPDYVQAVVVNDKMHFIVQEPDKKKYVVPAYDMVHIPGLCLDGVIGADIVYLAKESIGLSLASESFGAEFFGNGANADVVLTYPGRLSPKGKKNLGDSFDSQYRGRGEKTMVLEEGTKVEKITFSPDQSQFLQTRKFQVADIARFFRVPLHMINELDRSTNNNIEHQGIEFVMYTMLPWVEKWEQELDRKLFYETEKTKVFTKFNLDGLLRGDAEARATIMTAQFNSGALTANEIRKNNGLNAVAGGDVRYVNANLMPLAADGMPVKTEEDGKGSTGISE